MRLIFALEHRFDRSPDGRIWTQAAYEYSFWKRYLDVFDHVQLVARAREITTVPSNSQRADGEQVSFIPLPCYIGPHQYLLNLAKIGKIIRSSYSKDACFIARVPGAIGTVMIREFVKREHPYGLEVVGNPREVFSPDAIRHPLRPLFRLWFSRNLKRQCLGAAAACYVTEYSLQQNYPCPSFSVGVSDVELPEYAYVESPRTYGGSEGSSNVVFVGSLEQPYKAPHILIDAVAECLKRGLDLNLSIVGDGKHRGELEGRTEALGLGERVTFTGQLQAGDQVRAELDKADLFVLPSYTEGMPRAMLEAMARGLPCIGTTVGGILELLPREDMVPPGDPQALAAKVRDVLSSPARMSMMSERNLKKARRFSDRVLQGKRASFYKRVRDVTEAWLAR